MNTAPLCHFKTKKMSDAQVVTFDLLDPNLLGSSEDVITELNDEELKEVVNVVELLDCAKGDSLDDFEVQTKALQHKAVTSDELDRLASKNSAQNTTYQTQWAVAVMRGKFYYFQSQTIKQIVQQAEFACQAT